MRCTHGYGICSHFHLCVKNCHRDLKCGVSVFVHRLVFFAVHDHVIIIRTAPDDGCSSFFVLDLYFCRGFYRCSSGSACEGYIKFVSSVFQFQIFQLFSLIFLVIGSFLIFGSICFFCSLLVGGVFFLSVSSVVSSTSPVFTGSLTLTLWSYHYLFLPEVPHQIPHQWQVPGYQTRKLPLYNRRCILLYLW